MALRGRNQTRLNQLIVADAGGAGGFGKAGMVIGIRQDSRQGIYLDDVGGSCSVEPNVDSRPVAATHNLVRRERDTFDRLPQAVGDVGGAVENGERGIAVVPNPLGLEPIYRHGARRESV